MDELLSACSQANVHVTIDFAMIPPFPQGVLRTTIVSAVRQVAREWFLDKIALSVDTVVAGKPSLNVALSYARSRQFSHPVAVSVLSQSVCKGRSFPLCEQVIENSSGWSEHVISHGWLLCSQMRSPLLVRVRSCANDQSVNRSCPISLIALAARRSPIIE